MTEKELNEKGDQLANDLGMEKDRDASPDSQGRIRWKTGDWGNKTGLGLLRTLKAELATLDIP